MKSNTLSRRSFMGLAAVSPLALDLGPHREVTANLKLDHSVDAKLYVNAHHSADAAETWRRTFALQPFKGFGEWYLQSANELELPEDLAEMPGTLTNFDYVIGVAAAEESVMVGAFRRNFIGFGFRLQGPEEYALALAGFFADQPLPEPFGLLWNPTRLRAFIPTTESLGMDVAPSDAFWP